MHIGFSKIKGGRSGDQSSTGLSEQLEELGFSVERMKTGTSARVDGRSIDFSVMTEQKGDDEGQTFSYMLENRNKLEQKSCFITHTNEEVHEEIRKGLNSALYSQEELKDEDPDIVQVLKIKLLHLKIEIRISYLLNPKERILLNTILMVFQAVCRWKFN